MSSRLPIKSKMLHNNTNLEQSRRQLPRVLGLREIIAIAVGGTIGSGIFIVPRDVALQVQSPVLMFIVWIVGGVLCFFGALALSELGAMYPHAGGIYVYIREAFGDLIAFLYGWALFLIMDSGSIAALAVAFSTKYLPYFFPLTLVQSKLVSVALIAVLAGVNYIGVRWGAILQNILTVIKITAIIIIAVVVFIVAQGDFVHYTAPASPPFSFNLVGKFGIALVACLWAYKGWESTTFSAGEMKNPERNLPLGLLIGTVLLIFLYLLANTAYLYVFPAEYIAHSNRIAADTMNTVAGPIGASFIALLILFSITGAANGDILTGPRVYFAMARDGLFFKKIAEVHPRFLTPHVSIIVISAWSALLSISGSFEQLFTYVVFGIWIFMGMAVAAVLMLRRKNPDAVRPYRTWGYPYSCILFILAAAFIAINNIIQAFWNSMAGLVIIALGLPAYWYWKRGRVVPAH
jgi:basic amino acid/polyamine antiporter, APA family